MTLEDINKTTPLTEEEVEAAKKSNKKLKNFTDCLDELGMTVDVIKLQKTDSKTE